MKKAIKVFLEAIKGDENLNYTAISINKALFLLAVPMVIEMIFESLFALIDAFFVAKYVGINGVATVGLTESVLTIIYSLAWGISTSASALISRRIGEKDIASANKSLFHIFLITLSLGLYLGFLGYSYSAKILELMGASPEVISEGLSYTQISFLSSPIIMLLFSFGGALRGAGNASSAMKAMIIANLSNIFLDFIFIPILGFGVEGAAIATIIGRSIGLLYQFYVLFFGRIQIKLNFKKYRIDLNLISKILKISAGGASQFIIQSASWIFLIRILSDFGAEVVAGYTIAIRIIIFTILPSWGLANAASALVGQNLGAKKPDRANTSAYRAAFFNVIFLFGVAVLFYTFSEEIVLRFNDDIKVVETAVNCLKILCLGYIFFGFGMVMSQAINGAGDTFTPTLMNFISFWIIEIPLAYYLTYNLNLKENGVFFSIIISEAILALMAYFYFKSGRWKYKMI